MKDVLVTLRKIKSDMGTKCPKADMWCHFGTATIWVPDEGNDNRRALSLEHIHSPLLLCEPYFSGIIIT